jgi:hypothetical protein
VGKFTDTDLFDFETDYEAYFDQGFNRFINTVVDDLSTPQNSPVYTGYFASSWKAQGGSAVRRESRKTSDRNRREKEPWSTVYHTPTQGKDGVMTPFGVKKNMGEIKRRFGLNGYNFNFKKYPVVYIGNAAAYAAYALEDGLSLAYIQDVSKKVDQAFRESPRLASIRAAVQGKSRVYSPKYPLGRIPTSKTGTPLMGESTFIMEES